ncbi:protein of unknown function [Streptomyces sp. KY75]|nr:protein of unknown function [Streptomyces sp. KY75]CAD5987888.1 protein of unknown function [Streptomyces sp. KY70]
MHRSPTDPAHRSPADPAHRSPTDAARPSPPHRTAPAHWHRAARPTTLKRCARQLRRQRPSPRSSAPVRQRSRPAGTPATPPSRRHPADPCPPTADSPCTPRGSGRSP